MSNKKYAKFIVKLRLIDSYLKKRKFLTLVEGLAKLINLFILQCRQTM